MKSIRFLLVLTLTTHLIAGSSPKKRTDKPVPSVFDQFEDPFPVQLGPYQVYGTVYSFVILGGASVVGMGVELMADWKFNTCLMDVSQLIQMSYAVYYFWDTWQLTGDE